MAPNNLSWLSICKASRLKTIATLIGINSTGTKPDLCARICADLTTPKFIPRSTRQNGEAKTAAAVARRGGHHGIISIDMGIRNLAYCHISLPNDWNKTRSKVNPTVKQWTRIAISQKATIQAETNDNDTKSEPLKETKKEPFDPQTFAQHAQTLIADLLTHSPTQILIERQRFRSMGGSSVQEWTLRVNMFESMLYAVLHTYSALGLWHGSVFSVAPAKVNSFWLGKDLDLRDSSTEAGLMMIMGKKKTKKKKEGNKKSAKSKVAKIELVERWLREEGEGVVEFMGEAKKVGRRYLDKRGVKRGGGEDIGKLDDLADCLLQGMAWVRWEENRVAIVENGLEAVEELEGALPAKR